MLAIIVCAFLLVVLGYFVALCGAEIAWRLRDRMQLNKPIQPQLSTVSRRQIMTR